MSFHKKLVHLPPQHRSYKGGFAVLTYCPTCNKVGLKEDLHPVRPCPACSGTVYEAGQGRWQRIEGGLFKTERGEWTFTTQARHAIDKFYKDAYEIFVDRTGVFGEGPMDPLNESIPFETDNLDFTNLDFTK